MASGVILSNFFLKNSELKTTHKTYGVDRKKIKLKLKNKIAVCRRITSTVSLHELSI